MKAMRVLAILTLTAVLLLCALVPVAGAGRPQPPPDPGPQTFFTYASQMGGVKVVPGGAGVFNFGVARETIIPVTCYLVVYTERRGVVTDFPWRAVGQVTPTDQLCGVDLLAPLPEYYKWSSVNLPVGTYKWRIEAFDGSRWAYAGITSYLTVTRARK